MRFMVMHKMTEEMEKGLPPDQAIIDGVGQLIAEGVKDDIFVSGEGLKPSSERVHIVYKSGKRTITDGPFTEAKELVAGFGLVRVRSTLGMIPKPENPPLRFLSMHKLDERAETGAPPDPKLMAQMGALIEEMTKAGVLEATGGLAGTKQGARILYKGGKRTVVDGPFAESKELVAGYAIINASSKAAAIEWALRFGDVVKVNEIEVRQMPEW